MLRTIKSISLIAGFVVASTFGVNAATVVNVSNTPGSWALVDPTDTLNVGSGTWSGPAPNIVAGNLSGQYRSPFEGAAPAQVGGLDWRRIQYWNVLGNTTAVLSFAVDQAALSLLWGSVDTYNSLAFYLNGSAVTTVTNLDFAGEVIGSGASLISITNLVFDEVRFGSSGNSFEFSNVTPTPVPLPAGGVLLFTALGGLVLARRRRKAS